MIKKSILALAAGLALAPALSVPAVAQTSTEQRRWDDARARYDAEFDRYLAERDRYTEARLRSRSDRYRGDAGYDRSPYETDYDAARYYRDGPQYGERRLGAQDEVYRGSDGRYYCKRSDGTTGLIIGAAAGGILGNVIDGGRHRVGGTLIGGALGALAGRAIDQNSDIRCR
ncbi:MAG: 17 kDa surface antigen [Alphaproteobacteria bacterium]|nr:17 kDa surface antigen [Alphaproteobacteria bacterium]